MMGEPEKEKGPDGGPGSLEQLGAELDREPAGGAPGSIQEPETEEELQRLVDKELEEEEDEAEKGNIDARQRAIDEELRKLREELLSSSPDSADEEYDMAARVKQLNEDLAKEGPVEEKKNRKVFFPEDVVSLAVPPPEYTAEEVATANEEVARLTGEGGSEEPKQEPLASGSQEGEETGGNVSQDNEQKGEEQETQGHEVEQSGCISKASSNEETSKDLPKQEVESGEAELRRPNLGREVRQGEALSLPNRTDGDGASVSPDAGRDQGKVDAAATEGVHVDTPDGAPPVSAAKQPTHPVDNVENTAGSGGGGDPNDLEVEKLRLLDRPQEQNNKTLNSSEDSVSLGAEDEHVLIERGGKFFYVNVQDLSPEERESLGVMLPSSAHTSEPRTSSESELPAMQPRPPGKPRPATATGGTTILRPHRTTPPRAMSAKTSKEYDRQERQAATYEEPFGNARSRYGMTPEQKQFRREQARLRAQKAAEEKEREERERQEKEEMCESIFKAWVENKKKETMRQKQEEKQRRREQQGNKEERFPEEAFTAWMERKKEQRRAEKSVMTRMTAEERDAYFIRSREDCERAFRQWVRSKNAGLREARSYRRAESLESKKRARQSRKSKNLSKALEVAQTYRYNEYYGYRF